MKAATRAEARATATGSNDTRDREHRLRLALLHGNLQLPRSVVGWWLQSEEASR
jgi:hypothetical protein